MKYPILLASLLTAITASAQSFSAFSYTAPVAGNQGYTGSLGLDFDVFQPIQVTSLFSFDDDADGWTTGTEVAVAIYDRDTQLAVTPYLKFSTANPGELVAGSYRSLALPSPVALMSGGHYSIVAQGFNNADLLYNAGSSGTNAPLMDDGGDLIDFTGGGRNSIILNAFPTRIDLGPENRYAAGSFEYSAVPEPSSALLACAGGLLLVRRRRA